MTTPRVASELKRVWYGEENVVCADFASQIESDLIKTTSQRDELKSFAQSVITQANGDLTDKQFRPYVKALAVNALARL